MPSIFTTTAAALGLASTVVAQFGGPDLNTTCPNPEKTCQSFPGDFSNGGTYFQNSDLTTSFNFSSYFTGCQSNAYANNFLVFPDGHQIECSNTTMGTDGTIVTSTCPVAQSDLPSGLYSLIVFSNNGRKCTGLTAQRNIRIDVGKQQTLVVTPQVVFTSTSTPVYTKSIVSTVTSEFYAPTPTVTSTKEVANPTRTFTPRTVWETTTVTKNTKTLTFYDMLVAKTVITKQARCKVTASPSADPSVVLSYEPTPTGVTVTPTPGPYSNDTISATDDSSDEDDSYADIPETTDSDDSDDVSVTVSGDDEETDDSTDSTSTISKRAERNIMDDIREHLSDFMAARVQNLNNHVKRSPEQATLTSIITEVSMFSTIISTRTAPTLTTTETSLATTSTTSTPLAVTLYKNPVTTITLATPTGTRTRVIKMVTEATTMTKYKTVKIQTTVTPTKKAAKCSARGGHMI